jgi:hypothetical protein
MDDAGVGPRAAEGPDAALDAAKAMYRRVLAGWAFDLLARPAPPAWPQRDAQADYRDRNWRGLYGGSVLDD